MDPSITEDESLLQELAEYYPATTTRTETALSRYPIHSLSKTERVEIHIRRKGETGEADILWSVSPSRDYGEPRQLAYRLDTIVINRHIDQAPRPIPKLLRLGTLRDIARDLGIKPGGDQLDNIKHALHQNAGSYITAKIAYTTSDKRVRRFEAGFTRYSVIFTGEELPDERGRADAVYLYLNEHYWKLLNNVLFRPLDYDYQKALTPGALRFYELVSYSIFGALSKRRGEAKLIYSDYCLRAPQSRHFTRAQMQKQMYKLHRPHIESGYLNEVRYHQIQDPEGKADWEIFYVPGRRARAQYDFFRGRQKNEVLEIASAVKPAHHEPEHRQATDANPPLAQLTSRGIGKTQAEKLLSELPSDQEVLDQLEWGDHLIREARSGIRNPPGFYVYLVRDNVQPPPSFETSRLRKLRAQAAQAENARLARETKLRLAYEEYESHRVDRYLEEHVSGDAYKEAFNKQRKQVRGVFKNLPDVTVDEITHQSIRRDVREKGLVTFVSFEDFCQSHNPDQLALPMLEAPKTANPNFKRICQD